jgi:cell division protease FtsH
MFGGRLAEELIFGKENITTGAGNDIQQATSIARRMVTEFGFSDKLGRLRYADNEEEVFLGHSVSRQKNVSDATAKLIDEEVRRLIEDAEAEARRILVDKSDELEWVAQGLLEFESLSGLEVNALVRGESIHRDDDSGSSSDTPRRTSIPTGGKTRPKKGPDSSGGIASDPEPQPSQ